MARGIRIVLSHENAVRASRIAYARRPPFAAVDHIMVAVTNDGGLDIGGVRGCDSRLGHQKDRANLPLHQRLEPALLMLASSIAVQDHNVAGRSEEHTSELQSLIRSWYSVFCL